MTVYAPEFDWIMYHHSIKETKHIKLKTSSLDGSLGCIVIVEYPGAYKLRSVQFNSAKSPAC